MELENEHVVEDCVKGGKGRDKGRGEGQRRECLATYPLGCAGANKPHQPRTPVVNSRTRRL